MYDLIFRNKRIIQVILLIIAVPFVFFGVDSYMGMSGTGRSVAKIGDYSISQQEFANALRNRQESLRQMTQGKIDTALLNSPELRYAVLDALIERRLLLDRAIRSGMTVTDQQVQKVVSEQPGFKDESKQFSYTRYEQVLKADGMTPVVFESRVRQDVMLSQQREGYFGSSFVSKTVLDRLLDLAEQKREVSRHRIDPERFAGEVQIGPDAVKQYYESNPGQFQIPERVKVDYVLLSAESLATQMQLEPGEAQRAFEARRSQFQVPEARQASHILIAADGSAGAEARQKAQAQADDIYQQLVAKPERFAELAKKYSNDPGSAATGGDLGLISRGGMKDVPEFEAALFNLKEGEISPPVATKHGFHIIRLTKLQPAQGKTFEQVREEIERDLKKQRAGRRFAELADRFSNIVYEQFESLEPAAALLKEKVERSGWITRGSADPPLLNNPRLLEAVFFKDVLKDRRNSEAIEIAPNTLVAVRLAEHSPASTKPFSEVSAEVEKLLRRREATDLAVQTGRRLLAELREGKGAEVKWSEPEL
ncbi:MAG TPA: SurA N-terminal domain-containing protein, partial [Burkholderiales bacterium]|nr:SurA N-terminal domain-containing protein [Burkholderiales bacterium]